jgi:hypothetical protein
VAPSRMDMDLRGLRRVEELEARSRTCGHVVTLLCHRAVRRWRRDLCVRRGLKLQYVCLHVCGSVMWVALSRREVRRVSSWRGKWAQECRGDGVGEGEGRVWWKNVPASRWVRTRHLSMGGEEPCDMMDPMGQLLYLVEMV